MRRKVLSRYKVYIVRPLILKLKKNFGKAVMRYLFAALVSAQIKVLETCPELG